MGMTYDDGPHEHRWSDTVEYGIWTGNPYRRCLEYGCRDITLDLDDTDYDDDQALGSCGCNDYHYADCPIRTG